jgi:hypothetical protein
MRCAEISVFVNQVGEVSIMLGDEDDDWSQVVSIPKEQVPLIISWMHEALQEAEQIKKKDGE